MYASGSATQSWMLSLDVSHHALSPSHGQFWIFHFSEFSTSCPDSHLVIKLYRFIITFPCGNFSCTLLHRGKPVIWGVVLTIPVGYSRQPSAVNNPSVNKVNEFKKIMPWRIVSKYLYNRSPCSISTLFISMVTFIGIRTPPRTLPTPPWRRRRTLCPLLISLSSFFLLFQLLQGKQYLFKVRSVLHWHSIGTCLVWTKPPISLVMVIFLWNHMVSMIFVRKNIQLSTNIFVSTIFNHSIAECFISYESIMDALEELLLALLFNWVGRIIFPVSPASYHIDVREVVLSWWRNQELKEGPSYTRWISDFSLFLYARSARTCNRRCQCPQYDKHTLHCVLGSVPSNSNNSMFPTSRIICFDSGTEKIKWLILS